MNIPKEGYSPRKVPQNGKYVGFSRPGGSAPHEIGKWELCVGGVWGLCIDVGMRDARAGTRRRTRVGVKLWPQDSKIGHKPNTLLTIREGKTLNVNMLRFAMPNIAGEIEELRRETGERNPAECGTSAMRSACLLVCLRQANNHPPHPSPPFTT